MTRVLPVGGLGNVGKLLRISFMNKLLIAATTLAAGGIAFFGRFWRTIASILHWEIPATRYERWGLYTQAFIVLAFGAVLELRPIFTGQPVSAGYAIAALALAAVVMAARTDALTSTEKIVWIAICAVLFMWELDAIDRDRGAQEKQHAADMRVQSEQFKATLNPTLISAACCFSCAPRSRAHLAPT